MSRPATIDNLDFSRSRAVLSGTLVANEMPRVAEIATVARIKYRISGDCGRQGEPQLRLRLEGLIELQCQRCLEAVDWRIESDAVFELRASEALVTLDDMSDDTKEILVFDRAMSVIDFLEDEIILALPVAPKHAQCDLPEDADDESVKRPFDVLAALKKH